MKQLQYPMIMQKDFKEELISLLIENNALGFYDDPITLKSGKKSHWYVNWRRATDYVEPALRLAKIIAQEIKNRNLDIDAICGVPEGATKTAILVNCELAKINPEIKHPLLIGRSKPKEHGKPEDKYFIGPTNGKFAVLEDVITSGGSLLEFIPKLIEAESKVIAAISLTDRQGTNSRNKLIKKLSALKIEYIPLLTTENILPIAISKLNPSTKLKTKIENELSEMEE